MQRVKLIGLLVVSAVALVAFTGTASADVFKTGTVGAALSTKTLEKEVFSVTESPVECEVSKFEGKTEALASPTQNVHPVYEKCKAFGFSATVTTMGCSYTFYAATNAGMGAVDVEGCTTEKGGEKGVLIKVSVPFIATCEVLIRNQTVASAVSYANNGSNLKVKATGSGIASNVVTSTGACPLTTGKHEGGATPAGGTYFGEAEVSAAGTNIEISSATRCAQVAEAGTGKYSDSSCTNTEGEGKEYVKVYTGGEEIALGITCAVSGEPDARTGTYDDAKCTKDEGKKKEYLKVLH